MLSIFLTKSATVTTRSRSIGKLRSGSTVIGSGARSRTKVLQARRGSPLIIMPQLPQIAMRQDQRNDNVPSCGVLDRLQQPAAPTCRRNTAPDTSETPVPCPTPGGSAAPAARSFWCVPWRQTCATSLLSAVARGVFLLARRAIRALAWRGPGDLHRPVSDLGRTVRRDNAPGCGAGNARRRAARTRRAAGARRAILRAPKPSAPSPRRHRAGSRVRSR